MQLFSTHLTHLTIALELAAVAATALGLFVLFRVFLYAVDPYRLRDIPGPTLAKFTNGWLVQTTRTGHRSAIVHDLHKQLGPFVRISPKEVSVSEPEALNAVYGHSSHTSKSSFYETFDNPRDSVFSTRSVSEHARKRRIHANAFSPKSILEYEPFIHEIAKQFVSQWDRLCSLGKDGKNGSEGEGGWYGKNGLAWLDVVGWYNYFTFDVISSLAFGGPFGMVKSGKGIALAVHSNEMSLSTSNSEQTFDEVPIVHDTFARAMTTAWLSVLPDTLRRFLLGTFFAPTRRPEQLAFMLTTRAAVEKRMKAQTDRPDLLSKLLVATDDKGQKLSAQEIISEANVLLAAGSDTTSNTLSVITYHVAQNPRVQEKLFAELDSALGADVDAVPSYEEVKHIPYLEAVINEGHRLASTLGVGLPRVVPRGGLTILGRHFLEGTILSVPTYSVHRSQAVFGDDADAFRPERWIGGESKELQSYLAPFSVGPRACIGRNLATVELFVLLASVMRRYKFTPKDIGQELEIEESFISRPKQFWAGFEKRL